MKLEFADSISDFKDFGGLFARGFYIEENRIVDSSVGYAKDNYLEHIAKTYTQSETFADEGVTVTCKPFYVYGECRHTGGEQHQHTKMIRCGREWCTVCGEKKSEYHLRRVSRWWNKVMSMESIGYMVITFPPIVQAELFDRSELKDVRRYIVRKLKSDGIGRGLVRWHWAGEDGCTWFPHLNILFESAYLELAYIESFKADVALWLSRRYGLGVDRVSINYQYGKKIAWKVHKLQYVTRSTLRVASLDMVELLRDFRVTSSWGKWEKVEDEFENMSDNEIVKKLEESENEMRKDNDEMTADEVKQLMAVKKVSRSICSCCGGKINWLGIRRGRPDLNKSWHNQGGGYYVRVVKDKDVAGGVK